MMLSTQSFIKFQFEFDILIPWGKFEIITLQLTKS